MNRAILLVALALTGCGPKSGGGSHAEAPPPAPLPDGTTPTASSGTVTMSQNELVLPGPITFESDGATLTAASEPALVALQEYLTAHADITLVRMEGHVSASAGVEDETNYSGERAFAVGRWLRDHGVDCKRLLAAAFGSSKPVADDSTPEGRAQNTRVTLVVAELRGRPIGGMPTDGGAAAATNVCPE